jgi:pyrroloquinoline quinone biosynthesis protein D
MSPDGVPKPAFGFFVEEMEGEHLLYRLGAHKAIHLNETAAVIWKLCDGSRTVQQIVELLSKQYPDRAGEVASDVEDTIDQLVQEGVLLETIEPSGTAS